MAPAAPVSDWTGVYAGVTLGTGRSDTSLTERVVLGAEARRTWFADDYLGIPGGDMQSDTLLMRLAFRF